jgi:hypothetical protein
MILSYPMILSYRINHFGAGWLAGAARLGMAWASRRGTGYFRRARPLNDTAGRQSL